MNVPDSVRQALAAGAIAQSTIDKLGEAVVTCADSRALAVLADAVSSRMVAVIEDVAAAA